MTRQAYVDRKNNLMIFWSQKCGCSSLVDWFAFNPAGLSMEEVYPSRGQSPRPYLHKNGFLVNRPWATEDLPAIRKIVFSRDPFSRAVSVFYDKFIGRHERVIDDANKMKPFALRFWDEYFRGDYRGLSFVEYLSVVRDRVAARAPGKAPDLNGHLNTQAPFPDEAPANLYDETYDITKMSDVLEGLNRDYGYSVSPSVRRVTNYGGIRWAVHRGYILAVTDR